MAIPRIWFKPELPLLAFTTGIATQKLGPVCHLHPHSAPKPGTSKMLGVHPKKGKKKKKKKKRVLGMDGGDICTAM